MANNTALEDAAYDAITKAREDGAAKYAPDSWREETIAHQLDHINAHLTHVRSGDASEAHLEHLLCRAAIALALRRQGVSA